MPEKKYTKEECLLLLKEKYEELQSQGASRYPRRSDFEDRQVVAVKAFLGPWPRALEAAGIITYEPYAEYELRCGYSEYQKYQALLSNAGAVIDETEFGADVSVRFAVKRTEAEALKKKITEIGYGRDIPTERGERFDYR